MASDDELENIRRRRLEELRRQQAGRPSEEQVAIAEEEQARAEAEKDLILRQILRPEARERMARLRLARPEEARQLENQLIALAQQGRLQGPIDDTQLKSLLARLLPGGRDIQIRRRSQ